MDDINSYKRKFVDKLKPDARDYLKGFSVRSFMFGNHTLRDFENIIEDAFIEGAWKMFRAELAVNIVSFGPNKGDVNI
ncbi:hypothetical protein UFOVP1365_48 [uncultured Caudovirales phage]|uniref:Uncharacterized protein n=1 Tax=uncultured Caudovirales phage TaxID=2100421 RepID=A0A6J5RWV1_9CAUD|nr:hypothetical protein UFOVP1365_48 [uncultured Caudovirales phage]